MSTIRLDGVSPTVSQLRTKVATLRRDYDALVERERQRGRAELDDAVQNFNVCAAFLDRTMASIKRDHQGRLTRAHERLWSLDQAVTVENTLLVSLEENSQADGTTHG